MDQHTCWDYTPTIDLHVYCRDRNEFLLPKDIYENWVVFAVEQGEFFYTIGSEKYRAAKGDLVFCPPHKVVERKVISLISFHFFHVRWNIDNAHIPISTVTVSDQARFASTMSKFRKAEDSVRYTNHLFGDLWYLYCIDQDRKPLLAEIYTADRLIEKALNFIHENYQQNINIKMIADHVGLSQVQFLRRFQKEFSMKPHEYMTKLRMTNAKRLLMETNQSIGKISTQCGYQNEFYFSTAFKRCFNISPLQFRQSVQIKV